MKQAAKTVVEGIFVSNAFQSSSSEKGNVNTLDDTNSGQRTLNLSGLEIPYTGGRLNQYEKLYLRSAEFGDVNTVRKLVDNAKEYSLNVNCTDELGRGVIRIAIEAEQTELLQMLLTFEMIELRDSLLHAISEENLQAVELILQAQSERQQRKNLKVSFFNK